MMTVGIPRKATVWKRHHLSLSVDGAIRNKSFKGFTDKHGHPMTPAQARDNLRLLQARGVKFLPMSDDCEGFDPETGCPGHPITDELSNPCPEDR